MTTIAQPYRYMYETVAASQTGQVLGGVGKTGDFLHRLIITVNTAATGTVTILDGATSIPIMPASPGGGIGVYPVMIECASANGPWSVTTGAGAQVVCVGVFSA